MSRATVSKSRADKAKDKDKDRGGSTSVPVPPVNSDVVPGRFTENDWNFMLDKEDGEDFIVDIVGNIVDSALNVIYDNYIQKQLYPYTVTQARDAILQIIEWRFLARDEGETKPEEDATWLEEDEPLPCVPDAWAQGSVPQHPRPLASPPVSEPGTDITEVSAISNRPVLEDVICESHADIEPIEEVMEETAEEEEGQEEEADVQMRQEVPSPSSILESQTKEEKEINTKEVQKKDEVKVKQELKPRKPKYKAHRGPVRSAGLRNMNKTLDETERELIAAEQRAQEPTPIAKDALLDHMPSSCHSILKVQAGRPPGSKDVKYDERGNVISVVKLDPEKLPSHRVRTQFAVVDPAVEAAHARLVAMRTGRYISQQKAELARQQAELRSMGKNHGPVTAETSKSHGPVTAETAKSHGPVTAETSKGRAPVTAETSKHDLKGMHHAASVATLASSHHTQLQHESKSGPGGITPLPPPLIESMELSPGVVVKEGNRVKRGPKAQMRYHDSITSAKLRSLRPVNQMDMRDAQLTVADIINAKGPTLRPLPVTDPIPPIVPRPTPPPQNAVETA